VKGLISPRLWLFVWGGLGLALAGYIVLAASFKPGPQVASICKASALNKHPAFLTGEMADFIYAPKGGKAPDATFQFGDKELSLSDFGDKTLLVNFWATWCAPCLKELPSLDELQGAVGSSKFEVVAVAADPKGPEVAREYLDRLNIKNLKLYTDQRLRLASSVGGASVLPVSVLYDGRGNEIGRLTGEADWASAEARRLVTNVIDCS